MLRIIAKLRCHVRNKGGGCGQKSRADNYRIISCLRFISRWQLGYFVKICRIFLKIPFRACFYGISKKCKENQPLAIPGTNKLAKYREVPRLRIKIIHRYNEWVQFCFRRVTRDEGQPSIGKGMP